jgi:hypothetical protein
MHPELMHALADQAHAALPARRAGGALRTPRTHRLRLALGYRLVVTGWRLLDPGVSAAAAPPARTAGPRPA